MTIYRKPKDVPTDLPPARLYLDDLQQVIQIFQEAENADRVRSPLPQHVTPDEAETKTTFAVGDYICSSLEELPKIASKTRQLVIEVKRYRFYAKFELNEWATHWSSHTLPPEEQLYVYHKLKALFDERRILWRYAAHKVPWGTGSLLAVAAGFLLASRPSHPALVLSGWLLLALWIAALSGQFFQSTVILRWRDEHSTRRWEAAWKVVPPIITFLLGMLTLYLTHKIWPTR